VLLRPASLGPGGAIFLKTSKIILFNIKNLFFHRKNWKKQYWGKGAIAPSTPLISTTDVVCLRSSIDDSRRVIVIKFDCISGYSIL